MSDPSDERRAPQGRGEWGGEDSAGHNGEAIAAMILSLSEPDEKRLARRFWTKWKKVPQTLSSGTFVDLAVLEQRVKASDRAETRLRSEPFVPRSSSSGDAAP